MKELYDAKLARRFASAVRRSAPDEWMRAVRRKRASSKAARLTPGAAHILYPLLAGFAVNVLAQPWRLPGEGLAGFAALVMAAGGAYVCLAARVVLASESPRELLLLAPVSDRFIAGVEAGMRRRRTLLLLWDLAAAWAAASVIAACARGGAQWETAVRGLVSGLCGALPSLMLGFLATLLRYSRLHRPGLALELLLYGLVIFLGALAWRSLLGSAAAWTEWLPLAKLTHWAAHAGPAPLDAAGICLACGLTVIPVLWRLLAARIPPESAFDPDRSPEGVRFTAEFTAGTARRLRRRQEFLDSTTPDDALRETGDDWDDSEPLLFHPQSPETAQSRLSPEFRAALAVRARHFLEFAGTQNGNDILLQPLPQWSYSWWRIRRWLLKGLAGFVALLALWFVWPAAAPVAAAILILLLPLGALTSFKVSSQPAFQLISPGPGASVPLFAWLPVSVRDLWRGSRRAERRCVITGVLFALLLSLALWLISFVTVAGFAAAGGAAPVPIVRLASVFGIGSALQFAAIMAGLLHVLRSISPLRFATSALRHFKFRGLWPFLRFLFAMLCLVAIAASIVALATGTGAAAVGMEKPGYLRFCLYSLAVSEAFRAIAGEVMLVLVVRARGEYAAAGGR